jgi:hypothetical protein
MTYDVEIVLREQNTATTTRIDHDMPAQAWTERDVKAVLEQMLLAIDKARDPAGPDDRYVALRGFSWIVEPFGDTGDVVIAVEIPSGCAVAGPFRIGQHHLDEMVRRVLADVALPRPTVH